jgi:histidine ammonia-lyase
VAAVARKGRRVAIAPEAAARLAASRAVVEAHFDDDKPVYGLTTGLGPRVTHRLSRDEASALTVLGRSVALGPPLPDEVVRALMVVRLNGLLAGGAGCNPVVAERLADWINAGLLPVIPSIGSIGAGDLCLMAHLGLGLIGEGEARLAGETLTASEGLGRAGLAPLDLGPKDGLAICNASSASAGMAALALADAEDLIATAQIAAALSLEGFRGNLTPIDPRVTAARPQPGQAWAAEGLRALLAESLLLEPGAARRLQDPISLRCIAPVHGSLRAALDFARPAVDAELNGAADNPLVLTDDGEILSTGNFQTPLLALSLDTLSQAVAQVAALSLGRSSKLLLERLSGLPANLSPRGPSRSGFAPLLKTGEALVGEIRHLALPVPVEPRWAGEGVEDELTNAPLAARKAADALMRLRLLLAIELTVAAQAAELAKPERLGRGPAKALELVREVMPALDDDRALGSQVARLERELLTSGRLLATVTGTAIG